MCVCLLLCMLSFHLCRTSDLWTHQPRSHTKKVTQDISTFLLRGLPSFLSREGLSRPFPSSTVKSNFVYPRINRSPLVGHIFYYFIVYEEKFRFVRLRRDSNSRPNVKRVRGYQLNHRGGGQLYDEDYTVLRYFQHAHFITIVGVGKRGAY